MKKAILIIGPDVSGKTSIRKTIERNYKNPMVFHSPKGKIDLSGMCKPNTDLVVIEDCDARFDYEYYFQAIQYGFKILENDIRIRPQFIFCTSYYNHLGLSFSKRFDVWRIPMPI